MIINKEFGLNKTDNPTQGAYLVDELADLVEDAVLSEFERISDKGGVLGAMESMYQRGKIQEESLHYETLKDNGSLPIVGVNTYISENIEEQLNTEIELSRCTDEEKNKLMFDRGEYNITARVKSMRKRGLLVNGDRYASYKVPQIVEPEIEELPF